MCMTDYDYELGHASGGSKVYPSVCDLQRCSPCCCRGGSCGIVEVEVTFKKVIRKRPDDER